MEKDGIHRNREKSHLLTDSYLNGILLRIRRDFPESVGIKLLEEELEKVRIENGKNLSYITELEDDLLKLETMSPALLAQWKFEKKRDKEISKLKNDLEKAQKDAKDWQAQYFKLFHDCTAKHGQQ